ncbi:Alternative cytochrome c oxidase subunit 2 [Rhodovastum atsumiense]|uniref:cytochrome-c oxidase n=1 Tax=Rhodovastum atsumiense TaxID=504468 RepID=A0A5M6INX1_9PROT|nr:cytochrome c oxidase subunit II [Rhodovastum atsumiense]KAA5609964.1 cytochrome c oxidase subunit II [Rhodovastum atsumiense]CAH2598603.1 Alternative cytochrome c oxidase subunit 2 [Rhodovastum atsumiense]
MVPALVLVLIVVGSVLFHFLSPWWFTPIASNWHYIDTTILITFWITGFVFTAVVLFMAWCVFRFRHRPGHRAAYDPENRRLESWLGIATAIGVAAMLAPGLFVWRDFVNVPQQAAEIEIVGQQWQWGFRLPGKEGRLGTTDAKFVSADNPLGLNPDDPAGRDNVVVIGDDLHLPVGHPVKLLLRSIDVVHDFWVPEFRAKMDLMPGLVTYFWVTPTRTGTFEIFCAGFCGIGHPQMRGNLVVDTEGDYRSWLAKQKTFAELSPPAAEK